MVDEVAGNAAETVAEKVAEKVDDNIQVITEIVDHIPMTYILVALGVGLIIGVGIVLLMDDAQQKKQNAMEVVEDANTEDR
jgi:hypothetical protein